MSDNGGKVLSAVLLLGMLLLSRFLGGSWPTLFTPDEWTEPPRPVIPSLTANWRKELAALIEEMYYLARWLEPQSPSENPQGLLAAIRVQLNSAADCLSRRFGTSVTSTLGYLQAAQANLLRIAPLSFVQGSLSSLDVQARRGLNARDPRLIQLETLEHGRKELTENDRQVIVSCVSGANEEIRQKQLRLQSFRNVIVLTAAFLFGLVLVVAIIGIALPDLFPICFSSPITDGEFFVACPTDESSGIEGAAAEIVTPADVLLVEFVGFLGASLSAATSIKDIRGSSDPYSIPVALSFLKAPDRCINGRAWARSHQCRTCAWY